MKSTAKSVKGKRNGKIVQIDEGEIRSHIDRVLAGSVEETLNELLDAEADRICNAKWYERTPERKDSRAGTYERELETRAGKVRLRIPKLRKLPFETAIIERYRRRESSVEEALVEMYLAGVSVRRVEDITEALWGTRVSPSTVSQMNQKIYEKIEKWRNEAICGKYAYVYLDGIYLKRSWGGEVRNVSVLVAIGVNGEGYREVLGVAEGAREDKETWRNFLRYLKGRGLNHVKSIISDKCLGLIESIAEFYPKARWQRCVVHFYRNVFTVVPKGKIKEVVSMLRAIHAQEDRKEAVKKAEMVCKRLEQMKLREAAKMIREGICETLSYYEFPSEHWRFIRTNNPLERIMKEIRRRTRVVGSFPDGKSALMLVAARLRHIAGTKWGNRKYLDMGHMRALKRAA